MPRAFAAWRLALSESAVASCCCCTSCVVWSEHSAPLGVTCPLSFLLQSYYEEQKREQMQGPALKRLEEEQQVQAQTPPLVPLQSPQWSNTLHNVDLQQQGQQLPHRQDDLSADDAEGESGQLQPTTLQLRGARSWLGASRQLQHLQDETQPGFSWGEPHPVDGAAMSLGNSNRVPRPHPSAKPPLPHRPRAQISSEMSFLGGSAGSSGIGASSDSTI